MQDADLINVQGWSSSREIEGFRDRRTPNLGMSAQRTGHHPGKVEEDEMPDLWNTREEKLGSRCSGIAVWRNIWDWRVNNADKTHRTRSKGMKLLWLLIPRAQGRVPDTAPADLWNLHQVKVELAIKEIVFQRKLCSRRNGEDFQDETFLFLHSAALCLAAIPAKSKGLWKF